MAAKSLALQVGVAPACRALGVPRATFYRRHRIHSRAPAAPFHARPGPVRGPNANAASTPSARGRFFDRSPAEVVATLLDEGQYLCSERAMYRILAANQPVRERRNQLTHPTYTKPELVANGPNQTWSLGHHAPAGAETLDVLLPVRVARHLQPIHGRVDGRGARELRAGRHGSSSKPASSKASNPRCSPCIRIVSMSEPVP